MSQGWFTGPIADARWSRLTTAVGLAAYVVDVYAGIALGGGALLGRTGSPSLSLSLLATVVVALTFERVRRWTETGPARMFHRSGSSPYDVLSHFSETVTGGYATEELPARMAKLLAEGTNAQWAQVWLTAQDGLVLAASWPPELGDARPPVPAPGARDLTSDGRRALTVRHGGRIYGVFRLQERHNVALSTMEERLFNGLASQAGLVLRLIGLQADLAARRDELELRGVELQLSRERLIATQDEQRRRIERDIHDGAQQHLVALAVNLRVAETVAAKNAQRAAGIVELQADASRDASETLSELPPGKSPRHLAASGLGEALRMAFVGSVVPVVVDAGDVRLPPSVEVAFYFFASEAVQNATKHAHASHITAQLLTSKGSASLSVVDDGVGFAPDNIATTAGGSGLANMRDRFAAIGGLISFDSPPGRGTRVTATVAV